MNILVTGGAGFIGSHTCLELLKSDYNVIVMDNLSNSKQESLKRVQQLTQKKLIFIKADLLDISAMDKIFTEYKIDSVIHFAGLKAVGESVAIPLKYYQNNITGTVNLCEVMEKHNVKNLVFSSSATVYGDPHQVPIMEDFPVGAVTNPYGRTKFMIEEILRDLYKSDQSWNIALLRYFNPIGAHESGQIGEDPNGIPNNLLPYITQTAIGLRKELSVFGNDYPTADGTGVRDYIHVVDLAIGHLKAIEKLTTKPGIVTYNLGTGKGYSVLDVIKAFENASGEKVPYRVAPRRDGDIAECYADPTKALKELNWKAERGIEAMCKDAWKWQTQNPKGYE